MIKDQQTDWVFGSYVVQLSWCDQTEWSRSGWLMNLAASLEPESLAELDDPI